MANPLQCLDIFAECVRAQQQGVLIQSAGDKDKEYHFSNWFQRRLECVGALYDPMARNTYPDFRLVQSAEGYELKALAWPGRERDFDANSQVPAGRHNGRTIFYVFGRYPAPAKGTPGTREYPLIDLVICHGDFLNVDHGYQHQNKSARGFGCYGDIMIRDRKMYVAPTPFALLDGTTGMATLILPEGQPVDNRYTEVGHLSRVEAADCVVGYRFDLRTNVLSLDTAPNPHAGLPHNFHAYRLKNQPCTTVTMISKPVEVEDQPEVDAGMGEG